MPISTEHGDSYLLDDRKQLGFSLNGVNHSVQPNAWYTAGEAITKGFAISLANSQFSQTVLGNTTGVGKVFVTRDGVTEKTVGIALNSASAGGQVEATDNGIYSWPVYQTITWTANTSGTIVINDGTYNTVYTPAIATSASDLIDKIIVAYKANPRNRIKLFKFSSNVIAMSWVGSATPTLTVGTLSGATISAPDYVFQTSDIGNTAYISPVVDPTSPKQQFTTDRNYAVSTGAPPIEVGIVTGLNSLYIDFEGDSRGASNLSQVSSIAGENLVWNVADGPPVLSLGQDNKVYMADNRKSMGTDTKNRNTPIGFLVGGDGSSVGNVLSGTNVVIQKAGVISGFTALPPSSIGLPLYLGNSGTFTPNGITTSNISSMTPYAHITSPVGFVFSSTQIYVEMGFNSTFSDTADIGTIIAMKNATPDSGYLKANGDVLNIVGTTTLAGTNAGTWDGSALFNKIGTTFGGSIQWTVTLSGTVTPGTIFINGTQFTVTATTANAIATQIAGFTVPNYTLANPSAGVFSITHTSAYSPPVIVIGTLVNAVFTITGGTFNLPNIATTPAMQIKYNNWYTYNSPVPLYRIDTDWTAYPNAPTNSVGSSGSMATGGYFDIPISIFGQVSQVSDIVVDVFIRNALGTIQRKISSGIVDYTYGATPTYKQYGYQILNNGSNLRLEFAKDGLAYYDPAGSASAGTSYVAVDSSWTYKVLVYKTERFNKYYDYTLDTWVSQVKSLKIVGYTESTLSQTADTQWGVGAGGYFDRSTTAPVHTTRLNYDGNFYSNKLDVTTSGTFGTSVTSNGNAFLLKSNGNYGTIQTSNLTFDRIWSFPNNPGEILIAGATPVNGYFDRSITTPADTTRLNYNGNLHVTNEYVTNDINVTNNVNITNGLKVLGTNLVSGYFTQASTYGRPTDLARTTYSGKLVASHMEAGSVTGDIISALNTNGNFDLQNVNGVLPTAWEQYNNGTTQPVTGTGGSVSGSVLFVTKATNPVSGAYSAILSKDASVRQGHGASTTFNLPTTLVRQNKWLKVSFDYKTSGGYTDGMVTVWLVGVSNNVIVAPVTYSIPASATGNSFNSYFRADMVNSSYRLCFHISSPTASAFDLELARVAVAVPETSSLAGSLINGPVTVSGSSSPAFLMDTNHAPTLSYTPVGGSIYFQRGSGNPVYFGGPVDIIGITNLLSTVNLSGNLQIGTTKFTVNASTGNTVIQGTLDVTGMVTAVDMTVSGKAPYPIGGIYFQLPGQASPDTLFTGTWSNISASYAGVFFRVEGGNASAFGSGTQADSIVGHNHVVYAHSHVVPAHGHSISSHTHDVPAHAHTVWNHTHPVSGLTTDAGAHTHTLDINGSSTSLGSGTKSPTKFQRVDTNDGTIYSALSAGNHSHSINLTSGGSGDQATSTQGITTTSATTPSASIQPDTSTYNNANANTSNTGGVETRPINMTIRVWKRVS